MDQASQRDRDRAYCMATWTKAMGGGVMFPHHTEFRSALLMLMLDAKHQSDTCMTRELARASFFFSAKGQY